MKTGHIVLALFLLAGAVVPSQGGQATQDKQQSQQGQQQPQSRPTLGPAPAPTLRGLRNANIVDARKLAQVQRIYVERMDNSLGEKLIEALGKKHRVSVVADRKDADAVLRGTCFDSRRLKSLRTEVYLNDIHGPAIWQDSVHLPYNPPPLAKAVSQTADLIVEHLAECILEAGRK
jgi:hypothetical protein